jgi:hypothetical protein
MPILRRKMRDRRMDVTDIDHNQEYQLCTGRPIVPFGHFATRDDFEAAWGQHGERLTAEFVRENPGRRPFAWWLLVHKRERPLVQPGMITDGWVKELRASHFGFLHTEICGGPNMDSYQEGECEYLHRLGLLEPGEFERSRL